MATKSRRTKRRPQAKKSSRGTASSGRSAAIKRELADLAKIQAELRAELKTEKKRAGGEARSAKRVAKERSRRQGKAYRAAKKTSSRRYRARQATVKEIHQITNLINVGLYQPKKVRRKNGRKTYTKKQAERARRIANKNASLLRGHKFLKAPKAAREQFKRAGIKTTRTAVVIGDEGYDSFKLKRDRKGRFAIEALEKRKPGRRRKLDIITAIRPDDMVTQENSMRRRFDKFAKANPGARIRLVIDGQFGTFKTFRADQFDQAIAYLSKYRRSDATLYNFRSNITLSTVARGEARNPRDQEMRGAEYQLFRPINRKGRNTR